VSIILTTDNELRADPSCKILNFPPEFLGLRRLHPRDEAALIIESSPTHARAVAEGRSKRIHVAEPSDASQANIASGRAVLTDCAGNPSESQCPKSQLDNILSVRDEIEARKARETVRRRDEI
jgi:hypothetical protein